MQLGTTIGEQAPYSEQVSTPTVYKVQRALLAACIVLAPLSLVLYVLAWPENPAPVVINNTQAAPVETAAIAGDLGNTLHFIGGIAASFFLPIGYFAMSLLGMRRSPWLATVCAALSLIGWIPWAGLMGIDSLAWDIVKMGRTSQLETLWNRFNGDGVMVTFLLIYIIGHLLSAVLIAFMLWRLRIIPAWAAWAFALTSPLTMFYYMNHTIEIRYVLRYLISALWIIGMVPAAIPMLKGTELAEPAPGSARILPGQSSPGAAQGR
jgi:hypothetical protein